MNKKDIAPAPKGEVAPYLVDAYGNKTPLCPRHNTLSYFSAEAMAAAFGGDPEFIPANIGFVFYPKQTVQAKAGDAQASQVPDYMDNDIGRCQNWNDFVRDLQDNNADVLVVGFSYPPSLGKSPASTRATTDSVDDCPDVRNTITFHAVSNSQDEGAVSHSNTFDAGNSICQAVLLSEEIDGEYKILARVSLKDGEEYLEKPAGFEVALDWSIIFR